MLLILGMPALLWLGWTIAPDILSSSNLRFLASIFAIVWVLDFHFVQKSSDLMNLPGLTSRELERLRDRLSTIRKRVVWVGVVAFICAVLVWFVGTVPHAKWPWFAPVAIGLLIGVGLSYLVVVPGWITEIHAFSDRVREREGRKKRTDDAIARLKDVPRRGHGRGAPLSQ